MNSNQHADVSLSTKRNVRPSTALAGTIRNRSSIHLPLHQKHNQTLSTSHEPHRFSAHSSDESGTNSCAVAAHLCLVRPWNTGMTSWYVLLQSLADAAWESEMHGTRRTSLANASYVGKSPSVTRPISTVTSSGFPPTHHTDHCTTWEHTATLMQ